MEYKADGGREAIMIERFRLSGGKCIRSTLVEWSIKQTAAGRQS